MANVIGFVDNNQILKKVAERRFGRQRVRHDENRNPFYRGGTMGDTCER
jgi:hypothetical protein